MIWKIILTLWMAAMIIAAFLFAEPAVGFPGQTSRIMFFHVPQAWVAILSFLLAMIGLTCANIFIRLVWFPIRGTFELMGFCGALVTAFALGYTQLKRGHIAVDVLVDNFSARAKRGVTAVNSFLCAAFMASCAWQVWVKAETLRQTGEVTETLRIAYHPFVYGVAVGCASGDVGMMNVGVAAGVIVAVGLGVTVGSGVSVGAALATRMSRTNTSR